MIFPLSCATIRLRVQHLIVVVAMSDPDSEIEATFAPDEVKQLAKRMLEFARASKERNIQTEEEGDYCAD